MTAYQSIYPTLGGRQREVMRAIKALGNRATMHEVADHLRTPVNCISGRFSELERKEMIKAIDRTKGERPKTVWMALAKEGEA